MSITLGIDPGVSGAVAALDGSGILLAVHDMPTAIVGKSRKRHDVLEGQLAQILAQYPGATVWIEAVGAMPKQGVSSTFLFGVCYGICRGVAAGLGLRVELVTPQVWKRACGLLGADKDAARAVASRRFPSAPLSRVKDGGRADALLIAAYGADNA